MLNDAVIMLISRNLYKKAVMFLSKLSFKGQETYVRIRCILDINKRHIMSCFKINTTLELALRLRRDEFKEHMT